MEEDDISISGGRAGVYLSGPDPPRLLNGSCLNRTAHLSSL
jgi:hypothetical protein